VGVIARSAAKAKRSRARQRWVSRAARGVRFQGSGFMAFSSKRLGSGFGGRLRPQWRWRLPPSSASYPHVSSMAECNQTFAIICGGRSESAHSLARKPSPVPKGSGERDAAPQIQFSFRKALPVFSRPSPGPVSRPWSGRWTAATSPRQSRAPAPRSTACAGLPRAGD
jgi:hypothetical protein